MAERVFPIVPGGSGGYALMMSTPEPDALIEAMRQIHP